MARLSLGFIALSLFIGSANAEEVKFSAAYDKCMEASDGVTMNMIECMTDEHARWDKVLNDNYKAALKSLGEYGGKARQEQLKAVQRHWLKYRDANCDFYNDPNGGSMAWVEANSCFLSATAERAVELGHISQQ